MNERIRELAEQVGATIGEGFRGRKGFVYGITMSPEELEKFAELIRADERETCAKVCDELAAQDKLSNYYAVAAKAIRERGEK